MIVRTTDLTKRFGDKTAVNALNMTVRRGDIYGFIGKNGAGKTTVMRMIVGTMFPTAGKIELFGGMDEKSAHKRIGSLIESPGFYKGCTAWENMKRIAILTESSDKEISEALGIVGLSDTGSKPAGMFSLGMKQRLGIAMALLGKPEFMVLDEPINGLDPEGIKQIRDLVLRLHSEMGMTFLISSHLLDELAKIVTKYGIINDGVLIEEVDAAELIERTRDGLRIAVDDVTKAAEVLCAFAPPDAIKTDGGTVLLQEGYDAPDRINAALVKAGIAVSELVMHSGGLEEYFIGRIEK